MRAVNTSILLKLICIKLNTEHKRDNRLRRYETHTIAEQVAGWSQIYKGLTSVTVTGAGLEVPLHHP
ncbi:serine carboxypeptidase 2 [Artemisia annua]|uniref:Serine carboxypeptidase 2 n=1 Tax=Artemisia annua TaxID=35608 RepID=A0A2U1MY93_ARTAN|nr:serine carboxypeptidase 2 [Artemisia annua]